MILRKWDDLPEIMKTDSVKKYYDILYQKRHNLVIKRILDIVLGMVMLVLLIPVFIIVSIAIKVDSKGPVMFRQTRVTQYGKHFRIYKFRTMVDNADRLGSQVTTLKDARVTRVGKVLRKFRIDEIPQLLNILIGDMSFVGTRPEVVKYVECYSDEMLATLLLPAGVTSEASLQFKDEEKLLADPRNVDDKYVNEVLPEKMKYNLESIYHYSILGEFRTMLNTVVTIVQRKN